MRENQKDKLGLFKMFILSLNGYLSQLLIFGGHGARKQTVTDKFRMVSQVFDHLREASFVAFVTGGG